MCHCRCDAPWARSLDAMGEVRLGNLEVGCAVSLMYAAFIACSACSEALTLFP